MKSECLRLQGASQNPLVLPECLEEQGLCCCFDLGGGTHCNAPGSAGVTRWDIGDRTQVGHMQDKHPPHCAIALALK